MVSRNLTGLFDYFACFKVCAITGLFDYFACLKICAITGVFDNFACFKVCAITLFELVQAHLRVN